MASGWARHSWSLSDFQGTLSGLRKTIEASSEAKMTGNSGEIHFYGIIILKLNAGPVTSHELVKLFRGRYHVVYWRLANQAIKLRSTVNTPLSLFLLRSHFISQAHHEFSSICGLHQMSLEALPPELRLTVVRFVGADELRKSTACTLTVCKWWHDMAEPLLLEEVNLSAFKLVHISQHSMEAIKSFTFRLAIDVSIHKGGKGFLDYVFDEVFGPPLNDDPCSTLYGVDEPWATFLCRRLSEVGPWVRGCKRLTSLSLRIEHAMSPEEVTVNEDLSEWRQLRFGAALWASKLSDLKIDTLGAWLEADPHEDLCAYLAGQLPALRSVWLQLHSICPAALQFRDYLRLHECSETRIEKLVISLSMMRDDSDIALFSSHCRGSEVEDDEAFAVWIKRAKKVAGMFPSLKELWLLCHEKNAGNSPALIAREFVSNISREFERNQYDEDGFDPTDGSWSSLNIELSDEETDEDTDDD